eukprot:PITA_27820
MNEIIETESSSFEEEVVKPISVDVMVDKYESIIKINKNSVWEVVPRLVDKLVVGSRWIFKVKHEEYGSIVKYRAIFVAKGNSQVEGIDYEETFSRVASDENLIRSFKEDLARDFEIKDIGIMHYFLRLEVWKGDGEMFVSHGKYVIEIFQRFYMDRCKHVETPLETNWRKEDATLGEEVDVTVY